MSTLYNECDGVILFDNSQASKICEKVYGVKKPDFKEMNDILSVQLMSMMYPTIGPANS